MKNKRIRYSFAPPLIWRFRISIPMAMMLLLLNIVSAQNLIVNGTVNNTGTIRVKNQTVIAQSAVGGEIELKGTNQTLPAKQYQSVRLSGTGTKTTAGGDLSVQKNLTIASPVTLNITKGSILTLGDTLFESGILKGAIQKSANLSGGTTTSDFGKIGATITWSGTAPGQTTVIRVSDSLQFGNGNESVRRYYQVQPTDATAIGTVVFKFSAGELNGHDINNLQLWRSGDNGITWQRHIPVVDTLLKTISKSNVVVAGRWTIADTIRALGPLNGAAGIPATLANNSAPNIKPVILTPLNPYQVVVTDIFGTPVSNISVNFSVTSRPTPTSGGILSDTSVATNASGVASTVFTLGSKVGIYKVTATSGSLTPIIFTDSAEHGAAQSLAGIQTLQSKRILETLDSAFTITVSDIGGNPVDSALVQFSIVNRPANAIGDSISITTAFTNLSGKASTLLTLGNKPGLYHVRAKVVGVADSAIFTAIAKPGSAKQIAALAITHQNKPILTQLDTAFAITVSDVGGNPVDSAQVQFSFFNLPSGSFGQALSDTIALTNSSGQASTMLTLGSRVASYNVKAKVIGVSDSVIFTANATVGAPDQITTDGGNNQSGENGKPLTNPFVATILDQGGNPVPNDTVEFKIQSVPNYGAQLSTSRAPTNSLGQASTILTLGTKVGNYLVGANSTTLGSSQTLGFVASAVAGAPSVFADIAGNNQSATINAILASDYVVRVLDANGNIVKNAPVTFSIDTIPNPNSIGQSLSKTSVASDDSGLASTRLTLGNKAGDYVVIARVNNVPLVLFRANAKAGIPSSLAEIAGNNQSATVSSMLISDFVVRVLDSGGNNVPGTTVSFTIDSIPNPISTGQILSDTSVTTNNSGLASTRLTFGNKAGNYIVTARVNNVPILSFKATAKPGAGVLFSEISGSNQTSQIITQLTNEFVVRVADAGGNNVPGALVGFTFDFVPANATGYQLRDTSVLSDSNGLARTLLTVGNKVGVYRIKAHAAGISDTLFTVTATHGAAAAFTNVAGSLQVDPTATTLDTAFALSVKDVGGNAVPNANVKFAITGAPAKATGQALKDTLVTADSLGFASTYLTLGSHEGAYTVTASVSGTLATTFVTNAYYIYGDPNNDVNVNIADMTTIIDQIIGKKVFTEVDSIKSDLNKDGAIDTSDVNSLRDNILELPLSFSSFPPFIEKPSTNNMSGRNPESALTNIRFAGATTQLEVTSQGLRMNMENSVPVRGIELRIRLKDSTVNVTNANYIFSRAQQMNVVIKTANNEIRLLAYSLLNSEIQPGDGTILRIPKITSVGQIDTAQVILSVASNSAVIPEAAVIAAAPGKYPLTYRLDQNYPNPFNGSTTIQYEIPDARTTESKIAIHIFNVLGQKVKTLISAPHDPGQYRVTWNGTDESGIQVASGIYFYRLISKTHLTTKKMIYVK